MMFYKPYILSQLLDGDSRLVEAAGQLLDGLGSEVLKLVLHFRGPGFGSRPATFTPGGRDSNRLLVLDLGDQGHREWIGATRPRSGIETSGRGVKCIGIGVSIGGSIGIGNGISISIGISIGIEVKSLSVSVSPISSTRQIFFSGQIFTKIELSRFSSFNTKFSLRTSFEGFITILFDSQWSEIQRTSQFSSTMAKKFCFKLFENFI